MSGVHDSFILVSASGEREIMSAQIPRLGDKIELEETGARALVTDVVWVIGVALERLQANKVKVYVT